MNQLFRRLQNADQNGSGGGGGGGGDWRASFGTEGATALKDYATPGDFLSAHTKLNSDFTALKSAPAPSFYSDTNKEYVTAKGWKAGDDVVTSYRNLETLHGADKVGRTLVLPKDDKDVEGIKAFRSKLGVPESADKYELPVPQGDKGEFAKIASTWLHEAGVPKAAGQAIAAKWNSHLADALKTAQAEAETQSNQQIEGLKSEWGGDFAKKSEEARRFMKAVGFSEEETKLYEETFGTANMLKRWAGIGAKISEPGVVTTDGASSASQDARTKLEELRAKRIDGKITDSEWERLSAPLMELANKAA